MRAGAAADGLSTACEARSVVAGFEIGRNIFNRPTSREDNRPAGQPHVTAVGEYLHGGRFPVLWSAWAYRQYSQASLVSHTNDSGYWPSGETQLDATADGLKP